MKENLKIAHNAINNLVNDVKDFVKAHNGFISAHDIGADLMYAYVLDWDCDDVNEQRIIAIRVNKHNVLELIVTPYKNDLYDEDVTEDEYLDSDWYALGTCGDNVLTAPTILSIAESIEQYV